MSTYCAPFGRILCARLDHFRPILLAQATQVWPEATVVNRVLDLSVAESDQNIICGIMVKHMPKRRTILKEVEESLQASQKNPSPDQDEDMMQDFCDEGDLLYLEDHSGRVALTGKLDPAALCCGMIIALYGFVLENGDFYVRGATLPGPCPPSASPPLCTASTGPLEETHQRIMFMAGPLFPADASPGMVGKWTERIVAVCSGVTTKIIVMGNLFEYRSLRNATRIFHNVLSYTPAEPVDTLRVQQATQFLRLLYAQGIVVHVQSGENDPCSPVLPQPALLPQLLSQTPETAPYQPLVGNPHHYSDLVDETKLRICTMAGQSVRDIQQSTHWKTSTAAMKLILQCRHLAPSAPYTLSCETDVKEDPFILHETLDILASAVQQDCVIETDATTGTTLMALASFAQCHQIGLVSCNNHTAQYHCDLHTISL